MESNRNCKFEMNLFRSSNFNIKNVKKSLLNLKFMNIICFVQVRWHSLTAINGSFNTVEYKFPTTCEKINVIPGNVYKIEAYSKSGSKSSSVVEAFKNSSKYRRNQ